MHPGISPAYIHSSSSQPLKPLGIQFTEKMFLNKASPSRLGEVALPLNSKQKQTQKVKQNEQRIMFSMKQDKTPGVWEN